MYLLSCVQKNPATGRLLSVVINRAALKGSLTPFTYTFRVSFQGFKNAIYWPFGDNSAAAISGLPKITSRSISGGRPADFVSCAPAAKTSGKRHNKTRKKLFMRGDPFLGLKV